MLRSAVLPVALLLALACSGSTTPTEPAPAPTPEPVEVPTPEPAPEPAEIAPVAVDVDAVRPPWSVGPLCAVPQTMDADALFQEAASSPEGLEGGLILCEILMSTDPPVGRRWDLLGNPPDPSATLTIGDARQGAACADDTMRAVLSWPAVTVGEGDKVKLSVTDVDLRNHDDAGIDVALFEGSFPIDLRGSHFSASCRGVPVAALRERISARVDAARAVSKALRSAMVPEPRAFYFGYPVEERTRLRQHITDVAGYTGWSSDSVTRLLEIYESLQVTWARMVADETARLLPTLPDTIELQPGVSASIVSHSCDPSCALSLELANGSGTPVTLDLVGSIIEEGPIWAVRPGGEDVWLSIHSPEGADHESPTLEAGASLTLRLEPWVSIDEPDFPGFGPGGVQLVRVVVGGQHKLLPIKE